MIAVLKMFSELGIWKQIILIASIVIFVISVVSCIIACVTRSKNSK